MPQAQKSSSFEGCAPPRKKKPQLEYAGGNARSRARLVKRARLLQKQQKQIRKASSTQLQYDDHSGSSSSSGSAPDTGKRAPPSDSSFFSFARNVEIEGGQFTSDSSTTQNKTVVTINVHPSSSGENTTRYFGPHDAVKASAWWDNSASRPRSHVPNYHISDSSFAGSSDSYAVGFHERSQDVHPQNHQGIQAESSGPSASDDIGTNRGENNPTPHEADRSAGRVLHSSDDVEKFEELGSDVYYRHLSTKRRGQPLWLPEPNYHLPAEYQRRGVSLGDVGVLTSEGGFDYLFNVLLDRNHPFNSGRVPPNFVPLSGSAPLDIRGQYIMKWHSFIASAGVRRSTWSLDGLKTNFEISALEGAILVTPEGAVSEDLSNLSLLRQYTSENIQSWYRYANGPRGRELANGDLRLVIGCDKTAAWGMAAFVKPPKEEDAVKNLGFNMICHTDSPRIRTYEWQVQSGVADVRSGPDLREIRAICPQSCRDTSDVEAYENQCIFVRTLNITLSDAEWRGVMEGIEVPKTDGSDTTSDGPGPKTQRSSPESQAQEGSTKERPDRNLSAPSDRSINRGLNHRGLAETPVYLAFHPSKALNEQILQQNKDAKMAITDDFDWSLALSEGETAMPEPGELAHRVFAQNTLVRDDGGFVYLEGTSLAQQLHLCDFPEMSYEETALSEDPIERWYSVHQPDSTMQWPTDIKGLPPLQRSYQSPQAGGSQTMSTVESEPPMRLSWGDSEAVDWYATAGKKGRLMTLRQKTEDRDWENEEHHKVYDFSDVQRLGWREG